MHILNVLKIPTSWAFTPINMSWKYHINHIAKNFSKSIGILNRLKNILPTHVEIMIYNALILSKINYGILTWGYESESILKLQKKKQ